MKKAEIPSNEAVRLQALVDYRVLETPEEPAYDDLTYLASQICQTPIALVSLVDSERQWFKSHHGLEVRETPRDVSFCGHAIHSQRLFEVPDAFKDSRFADNPLATGAPNVRFYAGAPLTNPQGLAVGTLCVIDHLPRTLTDAQRRSLEALARQVVYLLELRKSIFQRDSHLAELRASSQRFIAQQKQLISNAKMSSLGTMAAGIAHEVNNPLAIIIGKLGLMVNSVQTQANPDLNLIRDLRKLEVTSQRIHKIIVGLKTFSRNSEGDSLAETEINAIADGVLGVCEQRMRVLGINFSQSIEPGLRANVRAAEISQVLLNLIGNSIDAVAELPEKWIRVEGKVVSEQIEISVVDSGPGIPEELVAKMMVPFFTTKPVGKGTGLGLSISKGLLESQGGTLSYDRASPNTCFKITLPLPTVSKSKAG